MKIEYTIDLPTGGTVRVTQAIDTTDCASTTTKPRPHASSQASQVDKDNIVLGSHFGDPHSGGGRDQEGPGPGGGRDHDGPGTGGGGQDPPGTGSGGKGNKGLSYLNARDQDGPGTGGVYNFVFGPVFLPHECKHCRCHEHGASRPRSAASATSVEHNHDREEPAVS